jgi:heme-degrading monooxygenase HmoA
MITRIVRMQLMPGKAKDFLRVFDEVNAQIRKSEGCLSVRLLTDTDDPDTVITLSEWNSPEDLEAYRASALFISTWRRVKPHFRSPALAFSMTETN